MGVRDDIDPQSNAAFLFRRGAWGAVVWARRRNGRSVARDYFESLQEQPRKRVFARLTMLSDLGKLTNPEQFRHLDGPIFELKTDGHRFLCFQSGTTWFMTNGTPKKASREFQVEIERAKDIQREQTETWGLNL